MAAPVYTTDLAVFKDFESAITIGEFAGFTAGRGQVLDEDYPIQGSALVSTIMNAVGNASCAVDYGSNIAWTNGWVFFSWLVWLAPASINTQANGGLVFCLGPDVSNFNEWNTCGSDFGSYPYGGWQNMAVDPQISASTVTGTPGTSYRWAGAAVRVLTKVAKGSPLGIDVIRYGRGTLRVAGGSSGDGYATFTGMAAANDLNSTRWGLFQAIEGGYKFKGLMYLGYGALTEFTDSDKNIVIDNTQFVQSTFNKIEIHNASSVINWTNINFTALGTVSKGQLEMIDNATFNDTGGIFTDMDTFIYQSNATITNRTWRRCNQVTQGGGVFDTCVFEASTADDTASKGALLVNDIADVTDCQFTSSGSGHAVVYRPVGAGPFNVNWDGNTVSGYAAGDGSTGDETILIYPDTVNATINLTVINGASTPTIMEHATYTGTFTLIIPQVTLTISSQVTLVGAEIRIYDFESTPPVFGTELEGVESHNATTYAYSGVAANLIYIQIMKDGYVEFGQQTTMPAASGGFYALLIPETNS